MHCGKKSAFCVIPCWTVRSNEKEMLEMRLIDAKRLETHIKEAFRENPVVMGIMLRWIRKHPTADAAPVVHGQWEWFDEDTGTPITGYEREWGWRCTHCKEELPDDYDDPDCQPKFKYCPNCGAKMDGDSDG